MSKGVDMKIFIVYCSPGGSTRHVAGIIRQEFNRRETEVTMMDLGSRQGLPEILDALTSAGKQTCLFIGSPVYRDVAIPPVMQFIDALPEIPGAYAVPFVTWGEACSGVALWQMSAALMQKGFAIAAAAKVVAVHSMMWHVSDPAGKGHPDKDDDRQIMDLVETLFKRLNEGNVSALSLGTLDYQPAERETEMKNKIKAPWMTVPKNVNTGVCTQCGICEEECPVSAIDFTPYPQFGQNCFDCFNCIRLCPENAIEPAISMDKIAHHIRQRVKNINEKPLTQIFVT
jgi:ferredoxin/flavodoxin